MRIQVQADPFDPGTELNTFPQSADGVGAVVSFTGVVRDDTGTLRHMEIEHYPGMTERAIMSIAEEAQTRWALIAVLIIHRHGRLLPQEPIMMVATAAAHRKAAFEAADFLMDYLKSRAPFWKKEVSENGETCVAAKEEDETALTRW